MAIFEVIICSPFLKMALCLLSGLSWSRVAPGNYHAVYAREAKPYAAIKFDKTLPYIPRYR